MDKIPCSSEEKPLSKMLQVSCSLDTNSTESTSAASGLTTPRSSSNNNSCDDRDPKWDKFYKHVDTTPPKATRGASYDAMIVTANKLLKLSESDDFKDKEFGSLTENQQVLLVFMIVKEMHVAFDYLREAARALLSALHTDSPKYKRMMSFVRLGGDRVCPIATMMEQSYPTYIKKNPEWERERAITIFKARPEMKPFIYIQTHSSYVCAFVACAALLHYCSYNGENDTEVFKLNVSRYIRDEVCGKMIANFTLTDMMGAYLHKVLAALLKSFGIMGDNPQEIEQISTYQNNEYLTYLNLEEILKYGRPVVFSIEVLPGFENYDRQKFTGEVSDYYLDENNKRGEGPEDRVYHAVLCIGIKPRNGKQPPMLLVQDSTSSRPFFSIGMDLLMSMELRYLQFCTARVEWKLNQNKDYTMTPETRSLMCGSPMSVTDSGVPRIVIPEEPAHERPDMSPYYDMVKVDKDGPCLCYEI
ncbi:hypothetical protein FRACYDRAFT_262067 [Fragilariopsis cylindrus CCMP1102]|uniref:Uncharacterized protein n=1 Tax=Fragilariopsis cylindrus CCMP1102 TaxID=635003 RepID=A0A1E7F960_9STRA|nr:hypothetical protein FRACYDRAFT_262067 [Fragilariopsis cylindrus CCMP1102]|eukprot:OEU14720.1 hypothetical protein FRACYDRAFT_262067 [Fragilariopsis cylindrus CCMP1102]